MQNETILNVFPSVNDQNRLVLVRTTTICGLEHLVLRQETHSPDVGWFVQSCVAIEPGQVAALKMTLSPSGVGAAATRSSSMVSRTGRRCRDTANPVILRFEEAS